MASHQRLRGAAANGNRTAAKHQATANRNGGAAKRPGLAGRDWAARERAPSSEEAVFFSPADVAELVQLARPLPALLRAPRLTYGFPSSSAILEVVERIERKRNPMRLPFPNLARDCYRGLLRGAKEVGLDLLFDAIDRVVFSCGWELISEQSPGERSEAEFPLGVAQCFYDSYDRAAPLDDEISQRIESALAILAHAEEPTIENRASGNFMIADPAGFIRRIDASLAAAATAPAARSDGPEPPIFFWWKGTRHELPLQRQQFKLLQFLWDKKTVEVSEVAKAVFGDRRDYGSWRDHLSKLNKGLADQEIKLCWRKAAGEPFLVLNE